METIQNLRQVHQPDTASSPVMSSPPIASSYFQQHRQEQHEQQQDEEEEEETRHSPPAWSSSLQSTKQEKDYFSTEFPRFLRSSMSRDSAMILPPVPTETTEHNTQSDSDNISIPPVPANVRRSLASRDQLEAPEPPPHAQQRDHSPPRTASRQSGVSEQNFHQSDSSNMSIPPVPAAVRRSLASRDQLEAPEPPPHAHQRDSHHFRSISRQSDADRHTVGSNGSWFVVDAQHKSDSTQDPEEFRSLSDYGGDDHANVTGESGPHDSQQNGEEEQGDHKSQQNEEEQGDVMEGCEPLHYFHGPLEAPKSPNPDEQSDGRTDQKDSGAKPLDDIDQQQMEYLQPTPTPAPQSQAMMQIRESIGDFSAMLNQPDAFDKYLNSVNKSNNLEIQYEFAVFLVSSANEMSPEELDDGRTSGKRGKNADATRVRLLKEAKSILQRLSDNKKHPKAQYYLAEAYVSGIFGKPNLNRAFGFFVAASKHGHVEANYRAGLCYEFGWGCRGSSTKAQKCYGFAASKHHPGAMLRMASMCFSMNGKRDHEGVNWLRQAADSADKRFNWGPYELGLLYEKGFGDEVPVNAIYTAQLFTKSADLRHAEAAYRMGDAYENGKLSCPQDPSLSIHFYTTASIGGHSLAMMALCAWYMIGAEPMLERDEYEAYEWAVRASETGM